MSATTSPQGKSLQDEIRDVLSKTARGKSKLGAPASYVTAYQILQRLPSRAQLVATYGEPGKGAGTHYSAASAVARALDGMGDVEKAYLDTGGASFAAGAADVEAGYELCAIYRLLSP